MGELLKTVTNVEACYEKLPQFMTILDTNKNGVLDRCEDALNLHFLGQNTKEYAMKFSHSVPFSFAKRRCDQLFNPFYE